MMDIQKLLDEVEQSLIIGATEGDWGRGYAQGWKGAIRTLRTVLHQESVAGQMGAWQDTPWQAAPHDLNLA